jgi:hypothetical protein
VKRGLPIIIVVTALVLGAAVFAAVQLYRVPDCRVPADEGALLDRFASDPVLAVVPGGAIRREEPRRVKACRRIGGEVSETGVHVRYDLPRDLTAAEVKALFGPVAANAGWGRPFQDGTSLSYTRNVGSELVDLRIAWQAAMTAEKDGHVQPAVLLVSIRALRIVAVLRAP